LSTIATLSKLGNLNGVRIHFVERIDQRCENDREVKKLDVRCQTDEVMCQQIEKRVTVSNFTSKDLTDDFQFSGDPIRGQKARLFPIPLRGGIIDRSERILRMDPFQIW
jgi:hypothetical protein